MRRRSFTTLTLFAALALILGWLPSSSWLRGMLGSLLVETAAASDLALSYAAISGYAWRGLVLSDARVVGAGLDVAADRVAVTWFLPALLVGELPLRLDVTGLAGDVEVGRLALPAAGGGPAAVRIRIDGARLDVADLRIAEIPFALPDVAIEQLEATSLDDGRWELVAALATPEGRLEGTVRGRLGGDTFAITLDRGDARVARHWWDGIEAGTVRGDLTISPGATAGHFDVVGGAIDLFGTPLTEIAGPIAWRGDVFEVAWSGTVVGGRFDAGGTVDIAAAHWSGEARVEAPLVDASRALLEVLGAANLPAADDGVVRGAIVGSGWNQAAIDAELEVTGSWLGALLDVGDLDLRYHTEHGLSLAVEGRWGEGPLRLRTAARDRAIDWTASAGPVSVLGLPIAGVTAEWTTGEGPVAGLASVAAADGPWRLDADVVLDADGLQAFVSGSAWGGPLTGALATATTAAARLEGGVTWFPPADLLAGAARVELRLAGDLALPTFELQVFGDDAVAPAIAGLDLPTLLPEVDLRGSLSGALEGGRLRAAGRLGPLGIEIDGADWRADLSALRLGGALRGGIGQVAARGGPSGWSAEGRVEVTGSTPIPGGEAPLWGLAEAVAWRAEGGPGGWSASADEGRWRVSSADGGGWSVEAAPVTWLGRPGRLDAGGTFDSFTADVALPDARATAAWAAGEVRATLFTADRRLDGAWSAEGRLALDGEADLGSALRGWLDVAGAVRVAATWEPANEPLPTGRATVTLDAPWAATADLTADGRVATWDVVSELASLPLLSTGTWAPDDAEPIAGTVRWADLALLRVAGDGITGAGTWDGWTAAELRLEPQDWRLQVSADGRAEAEFGASRASFDLADQRLDATIDLDIAWGELPARVLGRAAWAPDRPDGELALTLEVADGARARVAGDLRGITAALSGPVASWAGAATPLLGPAGAAALWGELQGTLTWSAGEQPVLQAGWVDRAAQSVTLAWTPAALEVGGVDWRARSADAGPLELTAERAALAPLLRRDDVALDIDGAVTLSLDGASPSAGALDAEVEFAGVAIVARLSADDATTLAASTSVGPLVARAAGTVTLGQAPAWRGEWRLQDDGTVGLVGQGPFVASAEEVRLEGRLQLPAGAWGPLAWPLIGAELLLRPDAFTLAGTDGLVGRWPEGFSTTVSVAGEPTTVRVRPSERGLALDADGAIVSLVGAGDLESWGLRGSLRLAALAAEVEAQGVATSVRGTWRVAHDDPDAGDPISAWATGSLVIDAGELAVQLRGEDLDLEGALGASAGADATASGLLEARIGPAGWSLDGSLAATRTAAGSPAQLRLDAAGRSVALAADVDLAGVSTTWSVRSDDLGHLPEARWVVAGRIDELAWAGEARTSAAGLEAALASADDRWRLSIDGARSGEARATGPDGIAADLAWRLDPAPEVGIEATVAGFAIAAHVGLPADGGDEGPWLRLDVVHDAQPWRAHVVGPLDPLALSGAIAVTDHAFAARLVSAPNPTLDWGGLAIAWADGAVVLDGRSEPGQLPYVELQAEDLRWRPSGGWTGGGRAEGTWDTGSLGALDLAAEFRGDGDLLAILAVSLDGLSVGGAQLTLPADPLQGVRGEAELAVPLQPLTESTLLASGPLWANGSGVGADLQLQLDGALAASGRLTAEAGAASARLSGPAIELVAELSAAVGEARLRLRDLALDGELAILEAPRLSADAEASWDGDGLSWRVDALSLTTRSSSLEGGGVGGPNGRVAASARVDVDLGDLRLTPAVSGSLRGPVSFDGEIGDPLAGTIAARLEAQNVEWHGLAATWHAALSVNGSAGDPRVRADWTARGEDAQLAGEASWRPADAAATLRASGVLLEARLDIDLALNPDGFAGGGWAVVGSDTWGVAADAGLLGVSGSGRWQGWSASLDPSGWTARVTGDLSAWPAAAGTLAGTIDLGAAERPVVDLAWRTASFGGVALGDGRVSGDAAAGWALDGTLASGHLEPDLQGWRVRVDGTAGPVGDTTLSFDAGTEAGGVAVTAAWSGATPVGPIDLRLGARQDAGAWRGTVSGTALEGELTWPFSLEENRLRGDGQLTGASVAGVPLAATLALAGSAGDPAVTVALTSGVDEAWSAHVAWLSGGATLEMMVPMPSGEQLDVRGEAWPALDLAVDGGEAGHVRLTGGWEGGDLRIAGALVVDLGTFTFEAREPASLRLLVPGIGGGLAATLPRGGLLGAIASVRDDGWQWRGSDGWTGSLRLLGPDGAWLVADGLSGTWSDATATIHGRVDATAAELEVSLDLSRLADAAAFAGAWPWSEPLEGTLRWDGAVASFKATAPWQIDAWVDPASRTGDIALAVVGAAHGARPAPSATGRLMLDEGGWGGEVRVETEAQALGTQLASLDLTLSGRSDHLALQATLLGSRGSATAVGRWDGGELLPPGWGPAGAALRELDLRVVGFDLSGVAGVSGISGGVGGSATLRGDQLFGRLASEALTIGERTDPATFEFQADLAGPAGPSGSGRLDLVGAVAQFDVDALGIAALVRLERFPLHAWVEAAVGPSDVRAEITGAVRGTWEWGDRAPGDLRVAAERVELERAGVVTVGELSFDWDGDALNIGRAAFEGRGTWQARGRITPELLDVELLAQAADFGPLLGLVPAFARYGVSAEGNLVLTAHGTPTSPDVALRTDDLALVVAGTRYRLQDTRFTLRGEDWSGRAEIVALDPVTGRLSLATDGRVGPFPEGSFSLRARADGDLDVPFLGRVDGISAELLWSDTTVPTLSAQGLLGSPFAIEGSLAPLDIRVSGRDLLVTVPFLAIADAVLDAELRLLDDTDGVRLLGRVEASQARIDLATRAAFVASPASTEAGPSDAAPVVTPVGDPRERFRFDGVRIVAPQRVTFTESFGNAEASVDVTLGGNAAAPRLSGQIAALRGSVRFAGRDLELTEAVATFDPTRGFYPTVRVAGRIAFEKNRVAPPGEALRFLAPAGQRFDVSLVLEGEATDTARGFTLDLTPTLTSDALVEGLDAGGARGLSELELLTLLTLGRLEAGGGFAGAVAQSALDTAVDLLITSELQAALSEALGVEVVELRTTAVSSLLDGGDPFGVSLRLGGYLSDEVFASYRVSTLGGDAFSNEVAFTYQLGPVAMDVTGRFDVAAGAAASVGPSLVIGGRYGFAPGWAVEAGLDLSTERSTARLGVTWRW